ncbi:MAG: hypothetical protein ACRCUT_02875 [Spirochaetota bacterium]
MSGAFIFRWRDIDGVGRYRLEIYKDKENPKKIFSGEFQSLEAAVRDLPMGECYWKVTSLDNAGLLIAQSGLSKAEISSALDMPVLVAPMNNSAVDIIKTRSLDFSWKSVPHATSYELALYQYSFAFDKLVKKVSTSDTKFSIKEFSLMNSGNYYWSLTAVRKAGGSVVSQSFPVKGYFNIPSGPEIKPPSLGNMRVYVE